MCERPLERMRDEARAKLDRFAKLTQNVGGKS